MNTIRFLGCAALAVAFAPLSRAQTDAPTKDKPVTTTVQVQTLKLARADDLVGRDVHTPGGENLGTVSDVVIHPKGEIAFLVVGLAGSLNAGGKLVPIPWQAARRDENGIFIVDVKPADLAKGKGFPKEEWPDMSKVDFWMDVDKTWTRQKSANATAVEASATLQPSKALYRGSALENMVVEAPEGEKLAAIDEFVVDPQRGRISFVVLKVGSDLGAGAKLVAVPWDALKIMPTRENPKLERFTLSTTKEKLEKAPEFVATTEGMAKVNEPDYLLRVYEYYSVPAYWKVEAKPIEPK